MTSTASIRTGCSILPCLLCMTTYFYSYFFYHTSQYYKLFPSSSLLSFNIAFYWFFSVSCYLLRYVWNLIVFLFAITSSPQICSSKHFHNLRLLCFLISTSWNSIMSLYLIFIVQVFEPYCPNSLYNTYHTSSSNFLQNKLTSLRELIFFFYITVRKKRCDKDNVFRFSFQFPHPVFPSWSGYIETWRQQMGNMSQARIPKFK